MAGRVRFFVFAVIGLNAVALLAILISAPSAEVSLKADAVAIDGSLSRLEKLSSESGESAERLSRSLDHEIWIIRGCAESLRESSERWIAIIYKRVEYPLLILALLNLVGWIALMCLTRVKEPVSL